jgi:hypothetical protein
MILQENAVLFSNQGTDKPMPRLGRAVVPNYARRIVERGHNKQVVFSQEADSRHHLSTLKDFKAL